MSRRATAAAILVIVAAMTACSGGPSADGDVELRWIDQDPERMLDFGALFVPTLAFEIPAHGPDATTRWKTRDLRLSGTVDDIHVWRSSSLVIPFNR